MQAMKCEICGSNDIVKKEGVYVCQHCGTKYTIEEAKKLIGIVKIDTSEENEKYLALARRAIKNNDAENGIKYWALVAENDPMSWEGVFYLPYCRIINEPSNASLVNPYTNAIKEAFDIIHEKEPSEKRVEIVKELCEYVRKAFFKMADKERDVFHNWAMSAPNMGKYDPPDINACEYILYAAELKIKEYYPELSTEANELAKIGKDHSDYIEKTKNSTYKFLMERQHDNIVHQGQQARQVSSKSGGCYIATCVYGSYDCPQVWTLRRYRDKTLATTWYGRTFIRIYYAVSPKLVKLFGDTTWFKKLWQARLDRLVQRLHDDGVSDTPYTDR